MQTSLNLNTYTLQIPVADKDLFLSLVKKMGWSAKKLNTNSIPAETLAALKEVRAGKDGGLVDNSSFESFVNSMN